jgi:hypothetical protein
MDCDMIGGLAKLIAREACVIFTTDVTGIRGIARVPGLRA